MNAEMEPKYDAVDGKLVNRHTGNPIPDDEPVFIIRAKDVHAVPTLIYYLSMVRHAGHRDAVSARVRQFAEFKAAHPERLVEPDTGEPARPEPATAADAGKVPTKDQP